MSYRTRFIEWCQRPSKIKIRTYNPRNVVVLVTFSILIAASIIVGVWGYQVAFLPPAEYTFIAPESIETLIITTDTTLTEDYFNTTIVIGADGVTLDGDGHTIVGPGLDVDFIGDPNMDTNKDPYWMEELNMPAGILLEGRTGVTVKNCRVTDFVYGFFLNGSSGNTLQGNTANNNRLGFMLDWSDGNILRGNTANNNELGFWLMRSDLNSLAANTANNNGIGFELIETYGNSFEANTANDNAHFGFWMMDTSNATLRDNTANGNNRGFEFSESFGNTLQGNTANNNINGFGLSESDGNSLRGNTANNNTHAGFHVTFSSSNNTLTGNIASNNEYGICYGATDAGSPNNSIYHNNFVNNIQQINIKKTVNAWDDGSGGNYWSDYTGVDANGDGIGDTPYVINKNNMDRFPLMAPMSVFDAGIEGGETN